MKEELLYGKKGGGGGSAKRKPMQQQPPQDDVIQPAINVPSSQVPLEKGEIEIIEAPVVADVPVIAQEPPVIAQETLIEDTKPMEE